MVQIFPESLAHQPHSSKTPFRIELVARKHNHTILLLFIQTIFYFKIVFENNNLRRTQSFMFCRSC